MKGKFAPSTRRYFATFVVGLYFVFPLFVAAGEKPVIGIISEAETLAKPLIREITENLNRGTLFRYVSLALRDGDSPDSTRLWIREKKITQLLLVGNGRALSIVEQISDIPIIYLQIDKGAFDRKNATRSKMLFESDPATVLAFVKKALPDTKQILVVYDANLKQIVVNRARQVMSSVGVEVIGYPVNSVKEAAERYQILVREYRERNQVIWLLNDPYGADETAIIPYLLKSSWERHIPLISSNPLHVKRGVLMGFMPDVAGLVKQIERMAQNGGMAGSRDAELTFVWETIKVINKRSWSHLGMPLDNKLMREFDAVFPQSGGRRP